MSLKGCSFFNEIKRIFAENLLETRNLREATVVRTHVLFKLALNKGVFACEFSLFSEIECEL